MTGRGRYSSARARRRDGFGRVVVVVVAVDGGKNVRRLGNPPILARRDCFQRRRLSS